MPYIGRSQNFGVRSRFQYQATASQTSFSGSDANSLTQVTMTQGTWMFIKMVYCLYQEQTILQQLVQQWC